jgi:hypothetical protein
MELTRWAGTSLQSSQSPVLHFANHHTRRALILPGIAIGIVFA